MTLLDVVPQPAQQLRLLAGGDQRPAFGDSDHWYVLQHLLQPGPDLGQQHEGRAVGPRIDVAQHQHPGPPVFVGFQAGELHPVAEHQGQVGEGDHLDVVPSDVPGRQVLRQQIAHSLRIVGRVGDDHVGQHPAIHHRAARRIQKTRRPQDRKNQRCPEERLAVALLVEPAEPGREQPVEGGRLLAILLVETVEIEAQVRFPHSADGQLKRLRAFPHGPSRAQRGQALQHVVFEVVGVHRRLLAHCRCNGVRKTGLQAPGGRHHAA